MYSWRKLVSGGYTEPITSSIPCRSNASISASQNVCEMTGYREYRYTSRIEIDDYALARRIAMVGRVTRCASLSEYMHQRAEDCPPFQTGRTLRCSYENRTSLPGSISKSSTNESSVFGLITSSMNFT